MSLSLKLLNKVDEVLNSLEYTSFLRDAKIDVLNGFYRCDCSSYVNSLFRLIDKKIYLKLKGDKECLKAIDYFNMAYEGHPEVHTITHIENLKAGDLLVWRKRNQPIKGDTGHIAILMSIPINDSPGVYKVRVNDCSKMLHDNDTRLESGVGCGDMFLLVDEKGLMSGYIWSTKRPKNKLCQVLGMRFSDSLLN